MNVKQAHITMKGSTLTLSGPLMTKGQVALDAELINQDLKSVKLSSFKGKNLLVLSLPSLDTGVCSTESVRFSKEISSLGKDMITLVISMDLPFAQKRWCGQEKITNLTTLSDYKNREFGKKYGLYIEELGLLARAVLLINKDFMVTYVHLVNELTHEPPYQEVLSEIRQL